MTWPIQEFISLYLHHGFSIIPTIPLSKRAAVPWKPYQERRPSEREIQEWMEKYWSRGYGVSIICGDVSNNLVVLDLDTYENPEAAGIFDLEKLKRDTLVVETPSGGIHVYFFTRHPTPSFNVTVDGRALIEVRGVGRYVLAPPSVVPDKRTGQPRPYRFLSDPSRIATISDHLPSKLAEIVGRKLGIRVETIYEGGDRLLDLYRALGGKPYRGRHPPCIEFIMGGVPEGMRNEAAIRLASYLLHLRRMRPERVLKLLHEWNARNSPPLPKREIDAVFKSITSHGYSYGCTSLKRFGCDRKKCQIRPLRPIGEDVWW